MMEKASCLFLSLLLLLLSFSSLLSSRAPLPPAQLRCHDDERSALLEFKAIFKTADQFPSASCLDSWKMEEGARNCCSWHGVWCGGPSSHVIGLSLSNCELYGSINSNSSIFRLIHLQVLNLDYNNFNFSPLPSSIGNLQSLRELSVVDCNFMGLIPYQIASLTHLQELDLSFNRLHGQIPTSLSQLRNITRLFLGQNNLTGIVQLDMFSGMEQLEDLILSFSNISLAIGSTTNYSFQNVRTLGLAQCNLEEFPVFLEKLDNLIELDLSCNNLSGQVPGWFLNGRLQTLLYLNLSGNSLTGFSRDFSSYNSTQLESLDLSFNKLQGSLPIPSRSHLFVYWVSNNMLSGEIPKQICDWQWNPMFLDLSRNNFTGELPQCLSRFSESLTMLALHSNNFHGRIPSFGSNSNNCTLEMIDLSDNQLQGPLPRSLSNCSKLLFLNLGSNRINDTFPSWLGSLSHLSVLILRSNCFHGGIEESKSESGNIFPELQVIDISLNKFQGSLPSQYFRHWRYMGESGHEYDNYYLRPFYSPVFVITHNYPSYDFPMTIINKGVEMEYGKILGYFKVVDLSSNNFMGEIPDSIASLHGLHLLNLSHNLLTGSIPPSLGALSQLEALDLSRNELTGEIPLQLAQLPFLSIFNVSYNNMSGHIPQGKQFGAFPNSSYWGNSGLCGDPLSRKCGGSGTQPPPPSKSTEKDEGSDVRFEIEWRAVALGYAVTFVIAAVIGHNMITKHGNWFARTLGLRQWNVCMTWWW